ncbi:MAG TPA: phosphodiesterase [Jatrophihabitans sp.]|nr:phosphodiesterase [Jatrophihabitans sp.]
MLIAQLSDPHLRVGPRGGEPSALLHRALGRALGQHPAPDCVLITGDVVDNGRQEEYEAFLAIAEGFPVPIHLVAGNHDDAKTMASVFGGTSYLGASDGTWYTVDHADARIVVLDSAVPGSMSGHLGEAQLTWLDGALAERPEVPALVCLHHPPVDIGMAFLDSIKLDNPEALRAVLVRHSHVRRILAGHVHRPITAEFAGITVSIAPSTFRQAVLDLETGSPTGYVHETPGLLLHHVTADGFVTHLVPTLEGPVGYY